MKINFKTPEQLEAEQQQAEAEALERNRRKAYQKESDPLFFEWQRGNVTEQDWLDKIEEIKQRFPKPSESSRTKKQ